MGYVFFMIAARAALIESMKFLSGMTILTSIILTLMIISVAAKEDEDLEYLFYAFLFYAINIIYSIIKILLSLELLHYPFNIVMGTMTFAIFWIKRFVSDRNKIKDLVKKLQEEDEKKDRFLMATSHEIRKNRDRFVINS